MALSNSQKRAGGLAIGGVLVASLATWQLNYTGANEGNRLVAYLDPVGIPTICRGHTGPEVHLGLVYTAAECDNVFWQDVHDKVDVPLSQCVHPPAAVLPLPAPFVVGLRDFTLNTGAGAACASTLVKLINLGKLKEACNQYPRWVYARGILLKGLAIRRASERQLCTMGL